MIGTGEERSRFDEILGRLGTLMERSHRDNIMDAAVVCKNTVNRHHFPIEILLKKL